MEFQQLKSFLAVAKSQNFYKAARPIQRTQPAVSLQVKALEEELGTKLFDRSAGHSFFSQRVRVNV